MSMTVSKNGIAVKVIKKRDDPDGIVRVSLGGAQGLYYCVYRGTKEQAMEVLEASLIALDAVREALGPGREPQVSPDEGRSHA